MLVINSLNGLHKSNSWMGLYNYVMANILDFVTFSGTSEVNVPNMKYDNLQNKWGSQLVHCTLIIYQS